MTSESVQEHAPEAGGLAKDAVAARSGGSRALPRDVRQDSGTGAHSWSSREKEYQFRTGVRGKAPGGAAAAGAATRRSGCHTGIVDATVLSWMP